MPLAPTTKAGRLSASPTAIWIFTDGKSRTPSNPSVTALEELGAKIINGWSIMQTWTYPDRVGEKQRKPRTQAALKSIDSNRFMRAPNPFSNSQILKAKNECKEAELQGKKMSPFHVKAEK